MHHTTNQYTIRIIDTLCDLEFIRDKWEALQWHPHGDIDFYRLIITSRSEIIRPHVIVLYKNGHIENIIAGRVEISRLPLKIGYQTILNPRIRLLTIIHGGILGQLTSDKAHIILSQLRIILSQKEVEAVYFHVLDRDSILYDLVRDNSSHFSKYDSVFTRKHHRLVLPDNTSDPFVHLKSKHRYWLRRLAKILENSYPNLVEYIEYTHPDDVDRLCQDVEAVALQTYHRAIGVGFEQSNEMLTRLRFQALKGRLFAYILYIQKTPRAFWIGTIYHNVLHLAFTGYCPSFKQFEIGTILLVKMIQNLRIKQPDIAAIDFGFGDASYKQKFGNKEWEEADLYIFGNTTRSRLINWLRTGIIYFSACIESIVQKYGLEARIKRIWRDTARKR